MKLFFLKSDSLYTIYNSIEKIERSKQLAIYIEDGNPFFVNERRGKQIKELCESKEIDTSFIVNSINKKKYIEDLGLQAQLHQQPIRKKIYKIIYGILFNMKQVHIYLYHKRHYAMYLIFAIEISIIWVIFYFLYSLILPSTTITIYPLYQSEPIVYNFRYIPENFEPNPNRAPSESIKIPYTIKTIQHTQELNITNNDINYLQAPAQGTVRIVNTTDKDLSLVPNTELRTQDGRLFQTLQAIDIPAWDSTNAWYTNVQIRAKTYSTNQVLQGENALLKRGDMLFISKLPQSMYQKEIYAQVIQDFKKLDQKDFVSQEDQEKLEDKLKQAVRENSLRIVNETINRDQGNYLAFPDALSIEYEDFIYTKTPLQTWFLINGSVQASIHYPRIDKKDISVWVETFLQERASATNNIVDINTRTVSFLGLTGHNEVFVVPTRVNVMYAYDFEQDSSQILPQIKQTALQSDNEQELLQALIDYPEIANATISHQPFRNNTIASTRSRIFITIQE